VVTSLEVSQNSERGGVNSLTPEGGVALSPTPSRCDRVRPPDAVLPKRIVDPALGGRVASSFAKDSAGQVLANNPARGGCVACDAGKRSRTYRGKSSPRSSMLSIFRTHCEKQLCVGRTLITSPIRVILLLDRKHPTQPRSPWVGQTSQRLAVSKRDERSGLNERPSG
jgi:hypothetical protein